MDKREKRKRVRMLLGKWGSTLTVCARLAEEIAQRTALMESALDIKGRTLHGGPRGTGPADTTAKAAQTHMERMEHHQASIQGLRETIETARRFESCMDEALGVLSEKERAVIELRYKRNMKYERIAEELMYSPAAVYAAEASAIDQLIVYIDIKRC